MADIFLSYANEDREAARALIALLEDAGWTVWSERVLRAGSGWDSAREEALRHARCMIVLWSAHSVKNPWVAEEAEAARRRRVSLIPVQLDRVELPIGLRAILAADLTDWDRSTATPKVEQLIADLESILARSGQIAEPAPSPSYPQQASESYGEPASAPKSSAPGGGGYTSVVRETAAPVAGAVSCTIDLLRPKMYRAEPESAGVRTARSTPAASAVPFC